MTPEQTKLVFDCVTCICSLKAALGEAGGGIGDEQLKRMSALELIAYIAPNNIRFIYKEPR